MRHLWYIASVCLIASVSVGCSAISKPDQAQAGEQVNPDAFLHDHLQSEPIVTVAEAYRAMVMLAEGDDKYDSFASREEYLLQKEIIRSEWKLESDVAIDRGSVAYMVLQILKVRSGVNMNLFGRLLGVADRRYAVRELAYIDLMEDRPPYRFISGAELVDLMGKADAYMAENGLYPEERTDVVQEVGARKATD